jgi:hypothetical protein
VTSYRYIINRQKENTLYYQSEYARYMKSRKINVQPEDIKPASVQPPDDESPIIQPQGIKFPNSQPQSVQSSNIRPQDVQPLDVKSSNIQSQDIKSPNARPEGKQYIDIQPRDVHQDAQPPDNSDFRVILNELCGRKVILKLKEASRPKKVKIKAIIGNLVVAKAGHKEIIFIDFGSICYVSPCRKELFESIFKRIQSG